MGEGRPKKELGTYLVFVECPNSATMKSPIPSTTPNQGGLGFETIRHLYIDINITSDYEQADLCIVAHLELILAPTKLASDHSMPD